MTANEYREKSVAELNDEIINLRREQFNLRMQRGSGQEVKPHLFQQARRDIARVKTIIAEKKRAGDA